MNEKINNSKTKIQDYDMSKFQRVFNFVESRAKMEAINKFKKPKKF